VGKRIDRGLKSIFLKKINLVLRREILKVRFSLTFGKGNTVFSFF
jgi:hypothetical protein